jgi:hypothetical protein
MAHCSPGRLMVERTMAARHRDGVCKFDFSIGNYAFMWQAFLIHNLVDRPVSVIEKLTHQVLTSTDVAGSALGGEAGKLIVLGGHFLPLLLTLAFLAALVVVASLSYRLIEQPAQVWGRNIGLARKQDKIDAPNPM